MYKRLGYIVYRRVLEYYSGDVDEDAFGNESYIFESYILLLLFNFDFFNYLYQNKNGYLEKL